MLRKLSRYTSSQKISVFKEHNAQLTHSFLVVTYLAWTLGYFNCNAMFGQALNWPNEKKPLFFKQTQKESELFWICAPGCDVGLGSGIL